MNFFCGFKYVEKKERNKSSQLKGAVQYSCTALCFVCSVCRRQLFAFYVALCQILVCCTGYVWTEVFSGRSDYIVANVVVITFSGYFCFLSVSMLSRSFARFMFVQLLNRQPTKKTNIYRSYNKQVSNPNPKTTNCETRLNQIGVWMSHKNKLAPNKMNRLADGGCGVHCWTGERKAKRDCHREGD